MERLWGGFKNTIFIPMWIPFPANRITTPFILGLYLFKEAYAKITYRHAQRFKEDSSRVADELQNITLEIASLGGAITGP